MINRKKDNLENQFGTRQTALFNVVLKNGKFINIDNGEPISFIEGSFLRIKTGLSSIDDDDVYREITKNESRDVLEAGKTLTFWIDVPTGRGRLYFKGLIISPLTMTKKNNKDSVITKCEFKLEEVHSDSNSEKINLMFNSLNQAFFQMSLKFRPNNKSHVCNVYNTFYTDNGLFLEQYRF